MIENNYFALTFAVQTTNSLKLSFAFSSLHLIIFQVCAVVGGTFTVAGIIDSSLFSLSELYKKHQLGKLS